MNVNQVKRATRLREWAKMAGDRQASGMTVKTWCERNGIKEARYYYGLCQVRKAVIKDFNPDEPRLEELPALIKIDLETAPAERSVSRLPSATSNPPQTGVPSSSGQQEVLSAGHIRLQYGEGILDIPAGTNAEAIAQVLKALRIHAI